MLITDHRLRFIIIIVVIQIFEILVILTFFNMKQYIPLFD